VTTGFPDGIVSGSYGAMRASSADRERAVDVLKAAFAEGRLDQDEYADRVGRVYSARTYSELGALVADLPVGPLGALPVQPVPWPAAPAVRPGPARLPVPQAASKTDNLALAAFLFGLGGFVTDGITAPLAIILAFMAATRMRRTGQRGAGLAAMAVILAVICLLAIVVH
jgi:hypothetical protein